MRADLSLRYACVMRGLPVVILAVLLCQPAPVRAQDRSGNQPLPPPPRPPPQPAAAPPAPAPPPPKELPPVDVLG
ncbi:MAG: hypothetical protein ABF946_12390, partial [Acetobacter papayae]